MKKYLLVILALGFLLRVMFINTNPPALYGDELTITLDSYSLLKTGHDQLGNFLPLTFKMGSGRPAGYVYGSIPFIAIFGPTALGVRALSILSGLGIIVLIYAISRKILSEKIAILAALGIALSPWDISLSRGGFEAHFALFLAILGVYLFIKAQDKPIYYILSALSFGLILHTYPTYKVSLILFLPLLIWYTGLKKIKEGKIYFLVAAITFIILGFLSLTQTFIGGSEERFSNINIFSKSDLNQQIKQKVNLERNITALPGTFAKFFHNREVEYSKVFIENYLQNFSLDFLVLHGDRNPRHNMATMGEIYLVDLILIFIGVFAFWSTKKRLIVLLLLWLFLAPIPTAIIDLPHALRSNFMLPPLIILSALGLSIVLERRWKFNAYLIGILFLIQFIFFVQKLYFLAPNEYGNFWSFSAKSASEIAINERGKYNFIILSDRIDAIEFAYPIYAKVDSESIINQNRQRIRINNFELKKFGNVYIGYIPETETEKFINSLEGKVLFIDTPTLTRYVQNYETIEGKDNSATLIIKRKQ